MSEDKIIDDKLEIVKDYYIKEYTEEEKKSLFSDLRKKNNIQKLLKAYTSINRIKTIGYGTLYSLYDIIFNKKYKSDNKLRKFLLEKDVEYIKLRFRCGVSYGKSPATYNTKYIYEVFNEVGDIKNYYDYSCGWGERLLYSLGYNINYYGTDPNKSLVENLNKLKNDALKYSKNSAECDIRATGSEVFNKDWEGKMDLCFSSPPYFDLEIYEENEKQSIYNRDFQKWVNEYIVPTFENCYKYLKKYGWLVINITNSKRLKHDIEKEVKDAVIKCGFKFIKLDNKLQTTYKITGKKVKTEKEKLIEKNEHFYWFKKIS